MSEMTTRVAKALEQAFKDRVAATAGEPFETTGVTAPGFDVWGAYAVAAIEAIKLAPVELDPFLWTRVWYDETAGVVRREQISPEDVKL